MSYQRREALRVILGSAGFIVPALSSSAHASVPHKKMLLDQQTLGRYRDISDRKTIRLPAGIFECKGLELGSDTRLIGAGQGSTIIRLLPGSNQKVLRNANPIEGNEHIEIRALTIDGAAAEQNFATNGIQMERVSHSHFNVEVTNCFGTGFLLSGGHNNRFGDQMYCHGNGRRGAGYGLYIFGSSDNLVEGGRFDDNCIGIAVEASRPGVMARNNRITGVRCVANRADFGQSGAGVHFEQSEGGDCDGGIVIKPTCIDSTGIGINNTGCALRIIGGYCANNQEAGIVTIAATGFEYDGITCSNNAQGKSSGYRSEMRFDDSDLKPASNGLVLNCLLKGTAPDGGIRTMSRHSSIRFVSNVLRGYRFPYILSSSNDRAR